MKARVDAMLMITPPCPRFFISRAAAWAQRNVPRRLVAITESNSAIESFSTSLRIMVPALLINTSGTANFLTTLFIQRATWAGFETSPARKNPSVPRSLMP
jgi:hypothetical protein